MPHITTCPRCGKGYEESSEEMANHPGRLCDECYCDDQMYQDEMDEAMMPTLDELGEQAEFELNQIIESGLLF